MSLHSIVHDARCIIFSKITTLKEIKNIIIAYPIYAKELYSCLITIEDKEYEIIPAEIVLRMVNLQSINIKILVNDENELSKISDKNFPYLHLILSDKFGQGTKGASYLKFMQSVGRFVRSWAKSTYQERRIKPYEDVAEVLSNEEESISEEEFFELPPSSVLDKTLIIERFKEDIDYGIDYDNDNGIRFIYDRGIVQIYKNNVGKIMFDLLDFLDKNNGLTGLEVFTEFINKPEAGATEEMVQEYMDFFGYNLDGLKTLGLSYQVKRDAAFWILAMQESKQLYRIYFLPTSSQFLIKTGIGLANQTESQFEHSAIAGIESTIGNNKITHFELPLTTVNNDHIPLVIQIFPNIQVIGARVSGQKREDRIQQIRQIASTYPAYHFIIFVGRDPAGPKLPNVEYQSVSLDHII